MMRVLSVENIILFHEKIIRETGGSFGVRDKGLIESAINSVKGEINGKAVF